MQARAGRHRYGVARPGTLARTGRAHQSPSKSSETGFNFRPHSRRSGQVHSRQHSGSSPISRFRRSSASGSGHVHSPSNNPLTGLITLPHSLKSGQVQRVQHGGSGAIPREARSSLTSSARCVSGHLWAVQNSGTFSEPAPATHYSTGTRWSEKRFEYQARQELLKARESSVPAYSRPPGRWTGGRRERESAQASPHRGARPLRAGELARLALLLQQFVELAAAHAVVRAACGVITRRTPRRHAAWAGIVEALWPLILVGYCVLRRCRAFWAST